MFNLVKQLFGANRTPAKRRVLTAPAAAHAGLRPRQTATTRNPTTDLLDNPSLKLDAGPDEGFDPYNTGTFNRSGSWERITKRRDS